MKYYFKASMSIQQDGKIDDELQQDGKIDDELWQEHG
jgi:hypothetical protein